MSALDIEAEWLESDGLGGFASGTVGGARTRRYHALLLSATAPPSGRAVLVNGIDAWIATSAGHVPISDAALRARRHPSRRLPPHRHVRADALADLDVRSRRRRAIVQEILVDRAGVRNRAALAAASRATATARWRSRPLLFGPRLSRAASREPGVRFRRPRDRRERRVAAVWRAARDHRSDERRLADSAGLVPVVSLHPPNASAGWTCVEDLASPGASPGTSRADRR